jgi:hypothetical protein
MNNQKKFNLLNQQYNLLNEEESLIKQQLIKTQYEKLKIVNQLHLNFDKYLKSL